MKIGIVLVNYNQNKITRECVDSLSKVDRSNNELEIFIVDNNSRENFEIKKEDYKNINVKLIKNNENLGFAQGSNIGIKEALNNGNDYVLILNNDTTQDAKFLLNLTSAMKNSSVGIVSPKIYFSKGREFHKDRYRKSDLGKVIWYAGGILDWNNVLASHRGVDEVDNGQFDKVSNTDFATGCAMLVKREVFDKIGLFDERYFLYLEDLDFSQRVRVAGLEIVFEPRSFIWHYNAASTGGSGSDVQDYFITRNRLLFAMKYASLRTKLALLRESIKLLISGRKWQRVGIRDFYLRRFGKGSFNL